MGTIKKFFGQIFGKSPSVAEGVKQVFPARDQEFVKAFYERWSNRKFLVVQLGDGYDQLTNQGFFKSAWFYFIWPLIGEPEWTIVGTHAEDESGLVVVMKRSGSVCYKYDDQFVKLAESFPDFIQLLRAAGWVEE